MDIMNYISENSSKFNDVYQRLKKENKNFDFDGTIYTLINVNEFKLALEIMIDHIVEQKLILNENTKIDIVALANNLNIDELYVKMIR